MAMQEAGNQKLTKRVIDALRYPYEPGSTQRFQVMDTELRGFGVRVYESDRKAFFVRYTAEDGQRRLLTIGNYGPLTVEQARRIAQEKLGLVVQGNDPAEARAERRAAPSVAELCGEYVERYARPHKKSWSTDVSRIERFLKPRWGQRVATSIKRTDVTELRDELGRDRPVEANRVVTLVHTIWSKAAEWGRLPPASKNPATGVTKFAERSRERWLTPGEVERIFEAVDHEVWGDPGAGRDSVSARIVELLQKRGPLSIAEVASAVEYPSRQTAILLSSLVHQGRLLRVGRGRYVAPERHERIPSERGLLLRLLFILYLVTGARKNELLGARWDHCDLDAALLWIPDTKAKRPHTFWLPPQAVSMLRQLPRSVASPYIFKGRKVGQSLKNVDKAWRRIRERAGVPDVTIHDLRRTVGSWMVQSGTPLPVIKSALNQSTDWAVRVYTRIGDEHVRRAVEEQGRRVFALTGEANEDEP